LRGASGAFGDVRRGRGTGLALGLAHTSGTAGSNAFGSIMLPYLATRGCIAIAKCSPRLRQRPDCRPLEASERVLNEV